VKGNAQPDHVHVLLSISSKFSVAMTLRYFKGKSPVRIHRELLKTHGTLFGRRFWSRGYCVSTVGLDEAMIRKYIQEQEKHERDQERGLFDFVPVDLRIRRYGHAYYRVANKYQSSATKPGVNAKPCRPTSCKGNACCSNDKLVGRHGGTVNPIHERRKR